MASSGALLGGSQERRGSRMPDLERIKAELERLLSDGNAGDAVRLLESESEELTDDERAELGTRVTGQAFAASRLADEGQTRVDNWTKIAVYVEDGETLEEIWDWLPERLQDFLRREADRSMLPSDSGEPTESP